ncbi:DUF2254 domain-containing protein [Jannaschia seohaensis]|uniref:Putative membrane protein n=1 Tax=Jannaschia seohaensis TaxID=475081 RepID=A0A2Y9B584_9RHOB|nr:DUF2254 domain-containing protein [Jannaschia seohaensis]PWJ10939.1 putative membrane protein [Jannaschia seohaensis]SSA51540.1 Uncharacterized membrane protein [Jannaschia seohaensis]
MFLSTGLFKLREIARMIWVRIALISALALMAATIAPLVSPWLPPGMRDRIDEAAVSDLLSVLSGSMLAVATFSLSVMVAAHHYAASQVTPRSHRLLRDDTRTQSALATFIGAFVYALVAISVINAGLFDGRDYVVLYGVTILVIALVTVALVRWVQQLSDLGSVERTTDRVEEAAREAMTHRMEAPWLGGHPAGEVPEYAIPIPAAQHGWVTHIDLPRLSALAEEAGAEIHLEGVPGARMQPGRPLMHVAVDRLSVSRQNAMAGTIMVESRRSFAQDPAFGIEVMSEIAQRALSPGLNDPRTATDVVARQLRLLALWPGRTTPEEPPRFPRLYVPPLKAAALIREAFDHIARDGAHLLEVQLAVQEALAVLAKHPSREMAEAARKLSARALKRSDKALEISEDRRRVRKAAPARTAPR